MQWFSNSNLLLPPTNSPTHLKLSSPGSSHCQPCEYSPIGLTRDLWRLRQQRFYRFMHEYCESLAPNYSNDTMLHLLSPNESLTSQFGFSNSHVQFNPIQSTPIQSNPAQTSSVVLYACLFRKRVPRTSFDPATSMLWNGMDSRIS